MARKNVVLLAALVAVVGLGSWLLVGRHRPLPGAPLDRVPAGATAVGWIDVGGVLGSELWKRVVQAQGGDAGLRRIERTCGFDPLASLSDVVLFATGDEPESLDRMGVVARGRLDHERLVDCVSKVVRSDGGEIRRVEVAGVPAVAGRGSSRAAFLGTDGVVAGSEPIVRDVIDVIEGRKDSAREDPVLSRLWDRVAGSRHVVLVGHLPDRWRQALRRAARDAGRTDLAQLASAHAFALGARLSRGLGLGLTLSMPDARAAGAAELVVKREVDQALEEPMLFLSALGVALRRLDVEAQGEELVITLELSRSQTEALIELGEELLAGTRERLREGGSADGDRPAPRAPRPDEVIRP